MIYDVTLPLSPELVRWPGDPAIEVTTFGDETVRISRWVLGSHAGTHVDAPAHVLARGTTVDRLNPETLLGPCRVFDMSAAALITGEMLAALPLAGVERLILRTRNSQHWQHDTTTFDPAYVGLDPSAARLLCETGIRLLGVDGLSVDPYESTGEGHALLLSAGIVIIEGLLLAAVPAGEYQLLCAPLKLHDGDGAPARVFLLG